MTTPERVLDALATVYDPELDEPITTLRFVSSCRVSADGDVEVRLRLPTPQCAPNFAFLMAADARAAVRRLPGVRSVSVELDDHYYTGEEINAALARGQGFMGAFPGETGDDDLEALRALFTRKARVVRESRLCGAILSGGAAEQVCAMRAGAAGRRRSAPCLELRAELGLSHDRDAPAFVLASGEPLRPDQLERWLRAARLIGTSLEANGGLCRSLLQVRHGAPT